MGTFLIGMGAGAMASWAVFLHRTGHGPVPVWDWLACRPARWEWVTVTVDPVPQFVDATERGWLS